MAVELLVYLFATMHSFACEDLKTLRSDDADMDVDRRKLAAIRPLARLTDATIVRRDICLNCEVVVDNLGKYPASTLPVLYICL